MPTRRSTLRLTVLLTVCSLLIPAAASARNRDRSTSNSRGQARGGMVLIDNPTQPPIEVLIDGELMGSVGADSKARFGPLRRGDHKVVTRYRCKRRRLTLRTSRDIVELRRGRPARIEVPYVRKGIVDVANDWIQPMKVVVDGRSVGTVRAGATLGAFVGRGSTVELLDPQGNVGLRTRLSLSGLETAPLDLNPAPFGYVTIANPARRPMKVRSQDGEAVRIRGGQAETLRLATGWTTLVASHRGRIVGTLKVLVSPFASGNYDIQVPTTGNLRFRNEDRFGVSVYGPSGALLAQVRAGQTVTIRNLPVGDCTLEVVARLRRRAVRERVPVTINAFEAAWVASSLRVRGGRYAQRDHGACDSNRTATKRRSRRWRYASR